MRKQGLLALTFLDARDYERIRADDRLSLIGLRALAAGTARVTQLRIPAVYMRGGTSKGVFFLAGDLPADPKLRDRILLRTIGSPDPYRKHTDGMGGGTSSTSKVVILSRSSRPDCDVDSLFGQVAIDAPVIDWSGN